MMNGTNLYVTVGVEKDLEAVAYALEKIVSEKYSSENDIATLRWLYKFPVGKTEREILAMYPNIKARNIDELARILSGEKSDFERVKDKLISSGEQKDLLAENQNIGDLKKYLMQVNNLNIKIDSSKFKK